MKFKRFFWSAAPSACNKSLTTAQQQRAEGHFQLWIEQKFPVSTLNEHCPWNLSWVKNISEHAWAGSVKETLHSKWLIVVGKPNPAVWILPVFRNNNEMSESHIRRVEKNEKSNAGKKCRERDRGSEDEIGFLHKTVLWGNETVHW